MDYMVFIWLEKKTGKGKWWVKEGGWRIVSVAEMSKHIIVGMAWTMREFLMCSSVDCPIHELRHPCLWGKIFRFIFGDPICTVLRQNSAEILMIHSFCIRDLGVELSQFSIKGHFLTQWDKVTIVLQHHILVQISLRKEPAFLHSSV